MKLLLCTALTMNLVAANLRGFSEVSIHDLSDQQISARSRRMLQGGTTACVNPTCTSPPCAAALVGDVGCTTVAGVAEYTHLLINKGDTIAAGSHIYGPFEAGVTSQQDSTISGWGCTDPSVAYDSAGGKDIGLTEREIAYKCDIEFPRIEGEQYFGVVGKCGGHRHDYHFHGSFACLYAEEGGHSTAVGEVGDHIIYGKWEDYDNNLLPLLDACGGHWGPTPDCDWCYHYHVQDQAPFTVGCMGPASDGGLVSVQTCRALYGDKCGDDTESIAVGEGETVEYDRFCPCYDADGSNVGTEELPALSTDAIAFNADTGEVVGDTTTTTTTAADTTTTTITTAADTTTTTATTAAESSTTDATTATTTTPAPTTTTTITTTADTAVFQWSSAYVSKSCGRQDVTQLDGFSGWKPDVDECKSSCEQHAGCVGVTFWRTGWCSHYSTFCDTPTYNRNARGAFSFRKIFS